MSSSNSPTHRSHSSSGSFDGSPVVFQDLNDGSPSATGGSEAGESYSLVENNSLVENDSLVENNSLVENSSLVESDKVNGSSDGIGGGGGGAGNGRVVWGLVIKAACLIGGVFLLRKLTKRTTRRDHTRTVAQALIGEKYTTEQAARDPMTYFNLRLLTCPAAMLADGGQVLYYEQAFWRTPERPYRQRFYSVKPCPKEMNCDVEVGSYAVRDVEEYKNFCDRPKNRRPQPDEVIKDVAEHLNTVYLSTCDRGRRCLYEGSTPPGGFPNSWNGASRCTSELSIFKNGEVHSWDRAYDDDGNQVWGVRQGPYEFKPASSSNGSLTKSDLSKEMEVTILAKD